MVTTENLIRKGFFPAEIIPPLNTELLADALPIIIPHLGDFSAKTSKACNITIPKLKSFRRNIGIPNPLHQIKISKIIEDNWIPINIFLSKSKLSITPIKTSKLSTRSIDSINFSYKLQEQIIRSTSSRFSIHLDISKFYNSIYTHSIPWAIHSKAISKAHKRTLSYFGNILDEAIRNAQEQQTVGIPIGPDTSRIISEIIAVAIDDELQKRIPNIKGLRIIDDYHLYFRTHDELERAKSTIQLILREYELELNPRKLKIVENHFITTEPWVKEIRNFKFSDIEKNQKSDIIEYFNLAFGYSEKFPNDHVISYAISKIRASTFFSKNSTILQCLLLKSMMIEPKSVMQILPVLIYMKETGHTLDRILIQESLEEFLKHHCAHENTFEISWALWISKSLDISLNTEIINKISQIGNSVVALVTLDIVHSKLTSKKGIDFSQWENMMNASSLYSENWLLVYEAYKKKWLPASSKFVEIDDFFKTLYDSNVEFYDSKRQIEIPVLQFFEFGNLVVKAEY